MARGREFHELVDYWMTLPSDYGAKFDATIEAGRNAGGSAGHLGHESGHGDQRHRARSGSQFVSRPDEQKAATRALEYMDLRPGTPIVDIPVDRVFIGSCTNARLEDLRAVARVVRGKHVAQTLKAALVVPGSRVVKAKAEAEGLDQDLPRCGI